MPRQHGEGKTTDVRGWSCVLLLMEANRANSSMPAARGDECPNQMFHWGYLPGSIDCCQPGVRHTSPSYLVTLLRPGTLSLRAGMSEEDVRVEGR